MTEALKKILIFNGALILFYSMLVGFPYALVIVQQQSADTVRDWSVAHDATTAGAIVLFVLGLMLNQLKLNERQYKIMAWSFLISFYCFSVSTTLEALFPDEGFSFDTLDVGMGIVTLLSAVAALTSLIGGVLLILGAYNALRPNGSDG